MQKNRAVKDEISSIVKILEEKVIQSNNIAIIPHQNPDGDAIGSALGIYHLLKKYGKTVRIISPSFLPEFLRWMPDANRITEIGKKTKDNPELLKDIDLIICVDFNSLKRAENIYKNIAYSKAYKILIDHHLEPENFTDIIFSDSSYSSTAEFLYDILSETFLKDYFDVNFATCIYTGILTDTGSFSFSSSNPNTFLVVAELLKLGIDKDTIYDKTFNGFSGNRMRFMGHILLNRMVVMPEIKSAYIYITAKDREDFKEQYGDTENFVNLPLSIKGVMFSTIFIERDNFIKISFRSKGSFSVAEIAKKHFNGGGHANAAGGESFSSLKETIKKFINIIEENYKTELI